MEYKPEQWEPITLIGGIVDKSEQLDNVARERESNQVVGFAYPKSGELEKALLNFMNKGDFQGFESEYKGKIHHAYKFSDSGIAALDRVLTFWEGLKKTFGNQAKEVASLKTLLTAERRALFLEFYTLFNPETAVKLDTHIGIISGMIAEMCERPEIDIGSLRTVCRNAAAELSTGLRKMSDKSNSPLYEWAEDVQNLAASLSRKLSVTTSPSVS